MVFQKDPKNLEEIEESMLQAEGISNHLLHEW